MNKVCWRSNVRFTTNPSAMGGGVSKKDSGSAGDEPEEEESAEMRFICDNGKDLPELAASASSAESVLGIIVPSEARTFPRTGMWRLTKMKYLVFDRGSQLRNLPFGVFIGAQIHAVVIPASVESIAPRCFHRCKSLEVVVFERGSRLACIEYKAFAETQLSDVVVANSVKRIASQSFAKSLVMGRVSFEDGSKLEVIEKLAFTEDLRSLYLPASVREINARAFGRVLDLRIDPGNTRFAEDFGYVFEKNALVRCNVFGPIVRFCAPGSLEGIGDRVFERRKEVQEIVFVLVSWLGKMAFYGTGIAQVVVPATVTVIHEKCFCHCASLVSVTFENGSKLQELGVKAFGYAKITEIELPPKTVKITGAFYGCEMLTSIHVNKYFVVKKGILFDKKCTTALFSLDAPSDVILPRSVTTIGYGCFAFCASVQSISTARFSKLKIIESRAFAHSSLKRVAFPRSASEYGRMIFQNCRALEQITFDSGCPIAQSIYDEYRREGQLCGVVKGYKNRTFTCLRDVEFCGVKLVEADSYRGTMAMFDMVLPESSDSW